MTTTSHILASGPGWRISDVVCSAGPHDRPYEERHESVCIAAVTEGTFQYRTRAGAALLAPGAILLGGYGHCFECGHEHATGDRCLAFHLAPDFFEAIVADVPGARTTAFAVPHLPPLPALAPLAATAEAAREGRDEAALEELTVRVAGAVAATLADAAAPTQQPSRCDEKRITDALRRIETEADGPAPERLSLTVLAREAAMSPWHFLRTFRQVAGMTPHQYVLRARLHRAAVRLRLSDEPVSAIAFDSGFNDLSTFNHRFRRIMGASPTVWRARAHAGHRPGRTA